MGPLKGFRIVEFAGIGPGPFCAMMLSDMGADLIRLDRKPSSPPRVNAKYNILNRGRPSVGIDLKTDGDLTDEGLTEREGDILNAIFRVVQDEPIRLYFVTRHGEKDPDAVAGAKGDLRSISDFADILFARAMAIRCLCPPDTSRPLMPGTVSTPPGISSTSRSIWAMARACSTSCSPSSRPKLTLSRMVSEKTRASWGT